MAGAMKSVWQHAGQPSMSLETTCFLVVNPLQHTNISHPKAVGKIQFPFNLFGICDRSLERKLSLHFLNLPPQNMVCLHCFSHFWAKTCTFQSFADFAGVQENGSRHSVGYVWSPFSSWQSKHVSKLSGHFQPFRIISYLYHEDKLCCSDIHRFGYKKPGAPISNNRPHTHLNIRTIPQKLCWTFLNSIFSGNLQTV